MSLRRNRDFRFVLAGQAVTALGDAVSLTAMPLLVLELTGSGALMGVVGALELLPDLVFGLPVGALADRWDRRRMIMWADVGRALLTALIPIVAWLDGPTIAVVLIVTVPSNVLRLFYVAGISSALPSIVGRDQLGQANSILEATLSAPFIVGPAIAGVLVAAIGAPSTIAIDAASFALSATSMLFLTKSLRAERGPERTRLRDDIKEGIRFAWRHRVLRSVIGYWSAVSIAMAGVIPTLSYYITIDRGRGVALFGYVGSLWSIGYLGGSLLAGRLQGGRIGLRMLLTGLAIGAPIILIAATPIPALFLAGAAVVGAGLAILFISYATLRPSLTPDELLGRIGSAARTVSAGLRPIGLIASGLVIEATSGGTTLIATGIAILLICALFGRSKTFRNATLPEPSASPAPSSH